MFLYYDGRTSTSPDYIEAEDLNMISNGAITTIPSRDIYGIDEGSNIKLSRVFKLVHAQSTPCYISSDNFMFYGDPVYLEYEFKYKVLNSGHLEFWRLST